MSDSTPTPSCAPIIIEQYDVGTYPAATLSVTEGNSLGV